MKSIKGFTIVELLIVIVIVGILAALSVVGYSGMQKRAARAAAQSDAATITRQLDLFYAEKGVYPASITECPTPSSAALCINNPNISAYRAIDKGELTTSGGYRVTVANPSYELTVAADKAVVYTSNAEMVSALPSSDELMQYINLAPIIDRYGLVDYKLSFDIKSADTSVASTMRVYFQNGSAARYNMNPARTIPITTEYVRHEIVFNPSFSDSSVAASWLAFYGFAYGNGNIPMVKNVRLELAR